MRKKLIFAALLTCTMTASSCGSNVDNSEAYENPTDQQPIEADIEAEQPTSEVVIENEIEDLDANVDVKEKEEMKETEKPMETEKPLELIMPGFGFDFDDPDTPVFKETSVHDPDIMRVGDTFYVIGSHMASAKTNDLMQWTQMTTGPYQGNQLAPNIAEDFKEALEWSETDTFWAGTWIQLQDGRFYMYYCNCEGSSPRAAIGLAIADNPEGPYVNQGIFLKSGMWGEESPDGTIYDATVHPNAIDAHVFFDSEGRLWMVYGSYSGGIFIMEMNPETGLPYPDQGYGKKLLGGNHSRIEAPYIIYSPETEYYYLFLTFGGLDANGGYNIRVARSKNPDGPYFDANGNDMINCKGPTGSFFNDLAIEPYGVKLFGNYQFLSEVGEAVSFTTGYKSPGHNSAYYDEETGKYFIIFHTRFSIRGEQHEIRVHQMFLNDNDWFVVAPKRYAGEALQPFAVEQLIGHYKVIEHGQDITADVKMSKTVMLEPNKTITGAYKGTWQLGDDGYSVDMVIDGVSYNGVFVRQYDSDSKKMIMTFTVMSENGLAVWGAGVALK